MTELDDSPVSQIVSDCNRLIAEPDGLTPEQCDKMITERCQPEHMAENRERFTCHVAEEDGATIGFIASSSNKIEELFVDPNYHRQGIATALFQKTESGCKGSILKVETTGFGIPFYEAQGMKISGNRLVTCGPLDGKELIQLEKKVPNQSSEPTRYDART